MKESRDIVANLEKIGRRIHVDTTNMTVSNLKQYLVKQPNVIHYIGHGRERGDEVQI